jgi:hypothetical protein
LLQALVSISLQILQTAFELLGFSFLLSCPLFQWCESLLKISPRLLSYSIQPFWQIPLHGAQTTVLISQSSQFLVFNADIPTFFTAHIFYPFFFE